MSEEEGRLIDSALALLQAAAATATATTTAHLHHLHLHLTSFIPSSAGGGGVGAPASIDDDLAAWEAQAKESNGTEVAAALKASGDAAPPPATSPTL